MLYNVGDMVYIREDLELFKIYSGIFFVPGMLPYRGNVALIGGISDRTYTYKLTSVNGNHTYDWSWSDDMLIRIDPIEAVIRLNNSQENINEQDRVLI